MLKLALRLLKTLAPSRLVRFRAFGIVLGSLLTSASAQTATDSAPFLVKSWRTIDGLPQNSVNAIVQTPDGHLWVGTDGGLARFDGVRFKNYGLADGLKSVRILDLADDGQGGLWIATLGGGLSHLRVGAISTLTTADGLAHNDVMALAPAEPGAVWVGTKRGVQHWDASGFLRVGEAEGLQIEVVALAADGDYGVWASAAAKPGLFFCQGSRCEFVEGPPNVPWFSAYALQVDDQGDLWTSIGNGMVLRRHAGAWHVFNESDGLPQNFIYRLARGAPGEIWAGSHAEGLYLFRAGKFQAVPGTDGSICSLGLGRDGVIWVGTRTEGLCRLTPARVTSYPVGRENRRGQVNGLVEERPGQFCVATYGGGLQQGPLENLQPLLGSDGWEGSPFYLTGLRMTDGAMYFGGTKVLARTAPGAREPQVSPVPDDVTALCESADGSLLLGTREGELQQWVGGIPKTMTNGSFPAAISGLARGPGSSLWVSTQGAGLFYWDAGQVQHWTVADGLPTDFVRTLHPDTAGTIWLGTGGGGLAWLEAGRLHAVNSRQGLGDDYISQILEDDAGNLWLGGQRGIFRVSKRELRDVAAGRTDAVHPLALDESDGMITAECTGGYSPAGLRSASGILYFSTVRGVVAVDPAKFGPSAAPPPVRIEEVRLGGRPMAKPAGALVLPPGPRELEIHYTAFNYLKPEQIRFRHRLRGLDNTWVEAGRERTIRISELPPGHYTLQVSAANQDGHWNESGASLAITVPPFFWQTEWFRAALILLLMAGGGGLAWNWARLHHRRALDRERLARAEAEARQHLSELTHVTRVSTLGSLATTLAHELNQPLAAIHSNAEAAEIFLQKDAPDLAELRAIFGDIRDDGRRAREVIQHMRSMLQRHPSKMERIEIGALVKALGGIVHGLFASHGTRLRIEVAPGLPPLEGDAVHLQQLLLNLILNALEAMGPCPPAEREVFVRAVPLDPGWLEISVTDHGPGFPPAKLTKLSEPFFTTKKDGMGMGLAICHSIAQAHGGRLTAENLPGGGAVVRLSLPASKAVG